MSEVPEETTVDHESGDSPSGSDPDGTGREEHREESGGVDSDAGRDRGCDEGGEAAGALAKSTRKPDTVMKPHDWDKVLAVAYLRALGHTKSGCARAVGLGRRTVIRWIKSDWWDDAKAEAADNWLVTLRITALVSVQRGVQLDPEFALKISERITPELAPPAIRNINWDSEDIPWDILNEEEHDLIENHHDPAVVISAAKLRIKKESKANGDQEA